MNLSCGLLLAAVVATTWPIWRYQHEYGMFARRAILAGVTREDSRVRRWLWAGRIARVAEVFAALGWALALVALAHGFSGWQWAALAVDAALLAAVSGFVMRRMAREVRAGSVGLATRRWPLAIGNMAALAVAFLAIDFFVGAPDTRGLAWEAVARNAFATAASANACPAAGWIVGVLAAVDALSWHAAEVLIPSLPNPALRLAAWGVFLLQAGIVAVAYTRLLLGASAWLDRDAAVSSRPFFITVGVILALALAAAFALRDLDLARMKDGAWEAVAWANPCRVDAASLPALREELSGALQQARLQERARASERVTASVDALYADVERGVDAYLDWYFTVVAEYQRLAALATGRFVEKMTEELERRVFGEDFARRLEEASAGLAAESDARLREVAADLGARVRSEAAAHPCWTGELSFAALGDIERDALRAGTAAAGGIAAGLVTARLLARRAASAAATRASSKRAFQGAAALAGRAVARRGGAALGAALGGAAACGPFAPLCALVAAGVTWITLDKAFIEVDKLRLRDAMRAEILAAAAEQKATLAAALTAQHHAAIDQAIASVDGSMQRVFVPARDAHGGTR